LLVGFIGGKLKVAKLVDVNEGNGVALRSEVFAFTLNSSEVTEDFLLRSLLSDFSREQTVRMSSGVAISRISFEDLANILITIPSIEEQEKICYNDAHVGIKDAELKLRQAYEDFRKDIHMKKHAMGQTMANLENWWSQLEKIRSQSNGIIDESAQVGRVRKISLKEILDRVHATIYKLSVQLEKFDTGYGFVKEEFALTEFIEEYISSNISPLFRFEYNSMQHRLSEDILETNLGSELSNGTSEGNLVGHKGDPIEYIKFPKGALARIFDNVVSNACAYGFVGREEEDNIVRIEIKTDGTDYVVEVSNNGLPLDSAMSPEEVTIYGRTSGDTADHFGIGGYEVKRLMEEFGDSVEIVADASSDFPFTCRLVFHDTNINSVLI
jgi:signal transduction histidine kinase